jgi:hypothetical protein
MSNMRHGKALGQRQSEVTHVLLCGAPKGLLQKDF